MKRDCRWNDASAMVPDGHYMERQFQVKKITVSGLGVRRQLGEYCGRGSIIRGDSDMLLVH